jgi:hypothetical protein
MSMDGLGEKNQHLHAFDNCIDLVSSSGALCLSLIEHDTILHLDNS